MKLFAKLAVITASAALLMGLNACKWCPKKDAAPEAVQSAEDGVKVEKMKKEFGGK